MDALNRCASNDYFSYLCLFNSRDVSQVERKREQEKYVERRRSSSDRHVPGIGAQLSHPTVQCLSCSFLEESHYFRVALLFGDVQGRLAILWVCVYIWQQQAHKHTRHTHRIRDNNIISEVKNEKKVVDDGKTGERHACAWVSVLGYMYD